MVLAKIPVSERKTRDKLELGSEKSAPVFIEKPENKIMMEGTNDFVEAVVSGNPFPVVTWSRGIRDCTDGPKFENEVDSSTGIVGLCFKKIRPEDEAKYTLKISNELGEEKVSFSVFVRCNYDSPLFSFCPFFYTFNIEM